MKNFSTPISVFSPKMIALCLSILMGSFFYQNVNAQHAFAVVDNSQISFAIDSTKNTFTAMRNAGAVSAEGNFVIKDGLLQNINAFKMVLPMRNMEAALNGSLGQKDSIGFELSHVMVLPLMRMIHIVGILEVGGVSSRTEMDFNFIINQDQSLTLMGTKSIKLDEYRGDQKLSREALKKSKSEIKLDMNLVLKNSQSSLAILHQSK